MRASQPGDALVALVNRDYPIPEEAWRSFWQRLRGRQLREGEALALVSSLSTRTPDPESVRALLASLREGTDSSAPALKGTVNVVGTGGGPSTFNLSTAAAFVAAIIGARVIKTGSRAYTSRCGSIDLLERLGVPLTTSYVETEAMVDSFGIAFAGGFVYPREVRHLAKSLVPFDMRAVGRFFNSVGPFLASVPVSAQVTGTSDPALIPVFKHLTRDAPGKRFLLSSNPSDVDELVSFEENVVYDSASGEELRLSRSELGLSPGSLEDLRPVEETSIVGHFMALLSGGGPPAAVESICLNAAALGVACGAVDDWSVGLRAAAEAVERGLPGSLVERMRATANDRVAVLR